jgi:CRP/FNR family transcriptional regulator
MAKHDALNFLPSSRVIDFPRKCCIYEPTRAASRLYLVIAGRVKVYCTSETGAQTLLRVAGPEEFFGEAALIPAEHAIRESAVSMEPAQVMAWTNEEIRQWIEKEPKLGLALAEYFGRQNLLLRQRIVTIANYTTGPRVSLALLQLARTNGQATATGETRLTGLTHQAIADYVGTSREIVTSEMNRLRRLGYLTYSRLFTDIHVSALGEWMRQMDVQFSKGAEAPAANSAG